MKARMSDKAKRLLAIPGWADKLQAAILNGKTEFEHDGQLYEVKHGRAKEQTMSKVVKAKYIREVPNFAGILFAWATLLVGEAIEDKEITCGECGYDFEARFKSWNTNRARCPACDTMNIWEGR